MFTWICPKCGTEVPPSYSECPTCEKAAQAAAAAAAAVPVAPVVPPVAVPPVAVPPVAMAAVPAVAAPPVAEPERVMGRGAANWVVLDPTQPVEPPAPPSFGMKLPEPASRGAAYDDPAPGGGMPSWLVALLSLLVVAALGFGVVYFLKDKGTGGASAAVADSKEPIQQAAGAHPMAKFIEITGLRLGDEKQRLALKFLVVNHSVGPLGGFDLEVHVKPVTAKPEDEPLFTITTPVKNIGPLESRDFTVPVNTKLKAYEMPDWQFLRATFRVKNAD